jgi:hypothetical protein
MYGYTVRTPGVVICHKYVIYSLNVLGTYDNLAGRHDKRIGAGDTEKGNMEADLGKEKAY